MITTPRLLLRPWRKTDLPAMAAVSGDQRVMQYFPGIQDEGYVRAFMGRQHFQQKERGYCFFAAELRSTGEVIGFIGLSYLDKEVDFAPCVEIGWRLHPGTWGKGLATEGAKACLDFGFNELGLTEIYSETPLVNLPSQRVMKKIGMERVSTFMHPELGDFPEIEECVVYRIVRP
ncbi:MAG: ribosomal-protein-alanine N-acetyltransferase [Neolewinella sp.]|jgi:RimJ/RimL family protein N-acetyltransferase